VGLSDRQWGDLGSALKNIHATVLPPELARLIRLETYTPRWRESLKTSMERIEQDTYEDPIAVQVADFMKAKSSIVLDLIRQTERLAAEVQARTLEPVLCHSDIHAGNVFIAENNALFIVDWDDPIVAPKERDLMYIGGGLMGGWRAPQEEEALFYQGYGPAQIDPAAMAYYRFERIIEDLAIYCEQLLMSSEGGDDREQSLRYLMSSFLPDQTIEIAYRSYGE
jgi:spectinomycin phosphotransferase